MLKQGGWSRLICQANRSRVYIPGIFHVKHWWCQMPDPEGVETLPIHPCGVTPTDEGELL